MNLHVPSDSVKFVVNSVGKKYAEVDRAYLAGFFDADGAIMACIEYHSEKKFKFRVRMFIKIAQKNKQFLQDIQRNLGWGSVRLNRRVYEYNIRNQKHVKQFIRLIYPYDKLKKKQLRLGLKILDHPMDNRDDLIQLARLADTLSGYNVRSQGRRKNYTSKIQAYFSSND